MIEIAKVNNPRHAKREKVSNIVACILLSCFACCLHWIFETLNGLWISTYLHFYFYMWVSIAPFIPTNIETMS